jgi:hypothetical protein
VTALLVATVFRTPSGPFLLGKHLNPVFDRPTYLSRFSSRQSQMGSPMVIL